MNAYDSIMKKAKELQKYVAQRYAYKVDEVRLDVCVTIVRKYPKLTIQQCIKKFYDECLLKYFIQG